MARSLPLENLNWPLTRVCVRQFWCDSYSTPDISGGSWTPLPIWSRTTTGMHVNDWERVALPQIARAKFTFRYGRIDDQIVGVDEEAASRQRGGQPWSPTLDGTAAPDLDGWNVRIQVADFVTDVSKAQWRTVFVGEVLAHEDGGWPGASVPSGERVYHCVDLLHKTSRWRLDRHAYACSLLAGASVNFGISRGHPGYNHQKDREAPLLGNRHAQTAVADGGTSVNCHTFPGQGDGSAAETWTDRQAIENACAITRPKREPRFLFKPFTTGNVLFDGASAWPVHDGDHAIDILTRVCRRDRGRGLVFLDWDDDLGSATGPLQVWLRAENQNVFSVNWKNPVDGSAQTIAGSTYTTDATANGALDLIGDHRVVDELFKLGGKDQFRLDGLESCGEAIEVLVTLGYQDGLAGAAPNQDGKTIERAWQPNEQNSFRAITSALKRVDERWRPVYQYHRLPLNWTGVAGDADNGTTMGVWRCDYRCDIFGNIVDPSHATNPLPGDDIAYRTQATSPLSVEFLGTLPLYEGYSYDGATPVLAGGGLITETADRRPPMALLRIGKNAFVHVHERGKSAMMEVRHNLIALYESSDMGNGTRYFSDTSSSGQTAGLAAGVDYTSLVFTVGIKLPHRVRLYSGLLPDDPACKRRGTVSHPGLHLWLAHPAAIWDLDSATGSAGAGHSPKRFACKLNADGSTRSVEHPGILRDDRARLAQLHALAWSWYGNDRQTLRFGVRGCGFLPSYSAFSGLSVPGDGSQPTAFVYPQLGQIITTALANGEKHTVNTPVTRIHYDNDRGVTRWETDWSGLDFVK